MLIAHRRMIDPHPHSSLGTLTPIEFAEQQGDRQPETVPVVLPPDSCNVREGQRQITHSVERDA
jgi:hypothetical protein